MTSMQQIAEDLKNAIQKLQPFIKIDTDDLHCSNVTLRVSKQAKEDWQGHIFQNSPYVLIMITSQNRFYQPTDKVIVELVSKHHTLPKLRKYTGTPQSVIQKIKTYLETL